MISPARGSRANSFSSDCAARTWPVPALAEMIRTRFFMTGSMVATNRAAGQSRAHHAIAKGPASPLACPPMLDIRLLREQPEFVKLRLATRDASLAAAVDEILARDQSRRAAETRCQQLQA